MNHYEQTNPTYQQQTAHAHNGAGAGLHAARGENLPGPAPNTAGPHKQDLLNKLDPTVDSMSGGTQVLGPGINPSHNQYNENLTSKNAKTTHGHSTAQPAALNSHSGAGVGHTHNQHGSHGLNQNPNYAGNEYTGSNVTGNSHTLPGSGHANTHSHTAGHGLSGGLGGTHNTHASQQVPYTENAHTTNTHTGHGLGGNTHTGHGLSSNTHTGPTVGGNTNHGASLGGHANERSSHLPGQGAHTTIHQGPVVQPGPATKTAGPHKSNLLNKLDPKVDSKATVSEQREYRLQ
jgi:hypothetical protein